MAPAMPSASPSVEPHQLTVVAYGKPTPQGSKTAMARGVLVDVNARQLQTWREDVKQAALRAVEETPTWERDYPAVLAWFTFAMPRPLSHFNTAGDVKPGADQLHAIRPDLDKLLRSTCDALTTAGVYRDDSRIAELSAVKRYVGPAAGLDLPGVRVWLVGVNR